VVGAVETGTAPNTAVVGETSEPAGGEKEKGLMSLPV
jgi:hypothetical protein